MLEFSLFSFLIFGVVHVIINIKKTKSSTLCVVINAVIIPTCNKTPQDLRDNYCETEEETEQGQERDNH